MPIIYQFNSSNRTESKKMQSTPSPSPSYCTEPVFIEKHGQTIPYIPIEIKNGRDAYAASLHMIFNHFAQFHISVVDIISDKYHIPVEEIMNTIKTDDRYTNMSVCPNIHELSKASSSLPSSVASVDPVETVVDSKKKVIKKIKINTDKKIKIKPKINSTNSDIVSNDNL
jgi:hypothetical protein